MNEERILTVTSETGEPVQIFVLDIIKTKGLFRRKEIIIYCFVDKPGEVYASYLRETRDSFSLDTITDPKDIDFVNREIDRVVAEADDE